MTRGKQKKLDTDDEIPCILEPVESLKVERPKLIDKAFRENWARLIHKIHEVDPLICAECSGKRRELKNKAAFRP